MTQARNHYAKLDAEDPLRDFRARFQLPEGVIYLDGNSLGPLPKGVSEKLAKAVEQDWGHSLISSWNTADWINLPVRIGDRLAPLVGAQPGEMVVGDSTSVNIFKLAAALLERDGKRGKIITERQNFPTDIYILEGLIELFGGKHDLVLAELDDVEDLIDDDTALVVLTQVNYRTGQLFDMASITARAKKHGVPLIWDLCHSAGALPIDLNGCGVDYAVGCSYKYLNGGPGAPAFAYISRDKIDGFRPLMTGWFSHARQFAFEPAYEATDNIRKAAIGTPAVLSLVALDAALDVWDDINMIAVRDKSIALCEAFIALVEERCTGHGLDLASPRDSDRRGSQVSFTHGENGYAIMQALIARGVIGDFRAPDILRFGFTPLYTRHVDVYDAVEHFVRVLDDEEWRNPKYAIRSAVT